MTITKIEFPAPHGAGQKILHQMGHTVVALIGHVKEKGNSLKVHFDDGSVVDYTLTGATNNAGGGMEVSVAPGVEA